LGLMWRLRKKKNKAIIKKGRLGIKPFENISWEAGYYGNRYYEAGKNKSGFFVVRELDRIANKVKVELIDAQGTFLDIWKKIQYYNADAIQWDDETSKDPIDKVKKKLSQEEIIRTP